MKDKVEASRKSKLNQLFISFAIVNSLLLIGFMTAKPNLEIVLFTLLAEILVFIFPVFAKTLFTITLDSASNIVELEFRNLLNIKTIKKSSISNFQYTYKREAISKGTSGKTLRLFIGNKRVALIQRGYDGWPTDLLDNLVLLLDKHLVKRKFKGYSLKDEYPDKTSEKANINSKEGL